MPDALQPPQAYCDTEKGEPLFDGEKS